MVGSFFISGILLQVLVGLQFGNRDGKDFHVLGETLSVVGPTFPLPDIVARAELAEAYEVPPAVGLPVELTLSPGKVYDRTVDGLGAGPDDVVFSVNGLCCHTENNLSNPVPDPADPALKPSEIDSCEQLYLTGLHLEQYRHATWSAVGYYEEALRRDPCDIRNNNALGLWYLRRARFELAEKYLRKAVEVLTRRNRNPYDGEPVYNLALCLQYQHRWSEAYDLFYKATWNAAWQDAGYLACARISVREGRWNDALDEIEHSLNRNWHNSAARALKTAILRHLGRKREALEFAEASLALDRFNFGCLFEPTLCGGTSAGFVGIMRDEAHNYNELALDYVAAGLTEEAAMWSLARERNAYDCMSEYYCSHWCGASGLSPKALPLSFPNRLEAMEALADEDLVFYLRPLRRNAPFLVDIPAESVPDFDAEGGSVVRLNGVDIIPQYRIPVGVH